MIQHRRQVVDSAKLNPLASMPYDLRLEDIQLAMQDVYDFLFDVNRLLVDKGLPRFEASVGPAILSGVLSDLLTSSLAKHSRLLVENRYHNGHPDLLRRGAYPLDSVKAGSEGVEVKATNKAGGAVDTHGARDQWMSVFVYVVSLDVVAAEPLKFTEVYLGNVTTDDFRRNERGDLGTRTATLHARGISRLREMWVYLDKSSR